MTTRHDIRGWLREARDVPRRIFWSDAIRSIASIIQAHPDAANETRPAFDLLIMRFWLRARQATAPACARRQPLRSQRVTSVAKSWGGASQIGAWRRRGLTHRRGPIKTLDR
jgi:hypothetical protein